MINRQIEVPQEVDLASLFGNFDENVKMLDKALSVNIASRDNALRVAGEIENGKVYAYQTQDGQKGVVYIQNLTGNAGSTDDPTVTATIVTKLQAK